MDELSDIWIDQCQAARDIREEWGTRKALGYLVGEKLLNYISRVRLGSLVGREDAAVRGGDQANLHDRRTAGVFRDNHACRASRPRRDRGTVSDHARRRHVR